MPCLRLIFPDRVRNKLIISLHLIEVHCHCSLYDQNNFSSELLTKRNYPSEEFYCHNSFGQLSCFACLSTIDANINWLSFVDELITIFSWSATNFNEARKVLKIRLRVFVTDRFRLLRPMTELMRYCYYDPFITTLVLYAMKALHCDTLLYYNPFSHLPKSELPSYFQFCQAKAHISQAALITALVLFMNAERSIWEFTFYRTSCFEHTRNKFVDNFLVNFFPFVPKNPLDDKYKSKGFAYLFVLCVLGTNPIDLLCQ